MWFKKGQWVNQAFVISFVINIGLLTSLVYIACTKETQAHRDFPDKKYLESFYVSTSSVEVLSEFFSKNFDELFEYLLDETLIEDGYRKRDFALACLVSLHFFDIQKALSGCSLQERIIEFIHKEGGERVKLKIFPGLSDEQFDAILHFAKTEKWPMTEEGLFFHLKKYQQPQKAPSSLKESFYLTTKFNSIWMLFNRLEQTADSEEILELMLESDWNLIEDFYQKYLFSHDYSLDVQRALLTLLVEQKSKIAGKYLLDHDLDFVLDKLDDARIIGLLGLIHENTDKALTFAKRLIFSIRSDAVHKSAALKLYELHHKAPPDVISLHQVCQDFQLTEPLQPVKTQKEEAPSLTEDRTYTVQPGDSLWKIAKKFQVNMQELKEVNNIKTSPLIKPGMILKIP